VKIVRVIPGRAALSALAAASVATLGALLLGVSVSAAGWLALSAVLLLVVVSAFDYVASVRAWEQLAPKLTRKLPPAFAVGVKRQVQLAVATNAAPAAQCALYDHADASLGAQGLPIELSLAGNRLHETSYVATPTRRGQVTFEPAAVRIRSRLGMLELRGRVGTTETRRVYPDFAQVARYAWLAGDRRLQEIGVKTFQQRGQGTDFKELSEYRVGDSLRHLDWRASLRLDKPIVREYQDERDQCVMLLVDCGRRMRADDRDAVAGTTHFDQVLNAVMLLTYVALKQGDSVGAMTFGTPAGEERSIPPRKGIQTLNSLMGQLYDVQPTPTHSDYVTAAQELLKRQRKRALVIIVTNFRDEDSTELSHAFRLLRSRHLVLLASLRERIVGELMSLPLAGGESPIDVASAHLYEQSRRDAFNRLAARDVLMVDAEPERLGIELVNRYHALKRAGTI
jgi:uncharacterized protein (DUF58 family)